MSSAPTTIDPPALAMVWHELGAPHERMPVAHVDLAPGDVLVAIELATICGSDVHTTQGHRTAPTPLVLGHEQVGHIVAISGGATASDGTVLALGDRVVWSLTVGCGGCAPCTRGLAQKCETVRKYGHERLEPGWMLSGGFASHVHVRAGTAIARVDNALDAAILAPVSCGTATAAAALDAASAISGFDGETVLIFGAGLIGLTACAMAADLGASAIVVDPDAGRRELATRFGATATSHPAELTFPDGAPAVAIDASGSPRAVASAIDSVRVGGVVVLVGSVFPTDPVPLDPESIVRRLVTVRGVHNYAARHLETAVRFTETRHEYYPLADLVGETVALTELDAGIHKAAKGTSVRIGVAPAT